MNAADRRMALPVFFLALAVYIFTYTGAFKSNDERALFAGMDSFAKRGEFTVNPIYWDYTHVGMITTSGDMVPNYEPAQMVGALPFYLWGRTAGAGVQGAMFFAPVVMAGIVALVFLSLLELGCGRRSALLGALAFGFATLAWPYSRTFFREPLTTFAYMLSVYALLRYAAAGASRAGWAALAGAGLGLALTTKQISVAIVPTLLVLAVGAERARPGSWRERALAALAAALSVAVFLALNRAYTQATLSGVEVFARDIVDYTTNPQLSQSAPARMFRAFLGLTVSPYKGLLWYSPALILGLIGAIPFTRRRPWQGMAFILAVVVHIIGYSRYNYWSGGVAWGSRYMLPVVPFLVFLAAPVWSWLAGESPRLAARWLDVALRFMAWALLGVSMAIQLLGIAVDLRNWEVPWLLDRAQKYGGIGQAIEALYLRPGESPVVGHLKLMLSGEVPLDTAWVQLRPQGNWALVPAGLAVSLLMLLAATWAFGRVWRNPRLARPTALAMAAAVALGSTLLLLLYRTGDARFDTYNGERFLSPMAADVKQASCRERACEAVFLMPDPALTDYFLNRLGGETLWYGVEPRPVDDMLAQNLLLRYPQVWLGRDRNAGSDEAEDRRGWERWLTDHAYKLDEKKYDDWARLLRFSAAGRVAESGAGPWRLGEMALDAYTLGLEGVAPGAQPADPPDDGVVRARPGEILQVGLTWRATLTPDADYTVFVQLLDRANQVVGQRDRWPGDGLHPTATMQAGDVVADRLALALPETPGEYTLITGMYRGDAEGLPRLTGPSGDFVELGRVRVEPVDEGSQVIR